jgi:hypothetical protein
MIATACRKKRRAAVASRHGETNLADLIDP